MTQTITEDHIKFELIEYNYDSRGILLNPKDKNNHSVKITINNGMDEISVTLHSKTIDLLYKFLHLLPVLL